MKILIVHDDEHFVSKLAELLQADGHQLVTFPVVVDAQDLFEFCNPEICIASLETNETSRSSFKTIARAADQKSTLLIACAQTVDPTTADLLSEFGASLFMYKRKDPAVLLGQVQRHSTRLLNAMSAAASEVSIRLDHRSRTAFIGDKRTELSRNEFNILEILLKNANTRLSRHEIMKLGDFSSDIDVRNIDVHVFKLRKKLGSAGRAIRTVRSEGYTFVQSTKSSQPESEL